MLMQLMLLYFQRKFRGLENRSSAILAGYGVLSQIAGSQQGLQETKAAQDLQHLDVIFSPLSFAASLSSTEHEYSVGQERLWASDWYWFAPPSLAHGCCELRSRGGCPSTSQTS